MDPEDDRRVGGDIEVELMALRRQIQRFRFIRIAIIFLILLFVIVRLWFIILAIHNSFATAGAAIVTAALVLMWLRWLQLRIARRHEEGEARDEILRMYIMNNHMHHEQRLAAAVGLSPQAISLLPVHIYESHRPRRWGPAESGPSQDAPYSNTSPEVLGPAAYLAPNVIGTSSQLMVPEGISRKEQDQGSFTLVESNDNNIANNVDSNLRTDTDESVCSVCLAEYVDGDLLITLPCQHCYHAECIKQWLSLKGLCPYCKQGVFVENRAEDIEHGNHARAVDLAGIAVDLPDNDLVPAGRYPIRYANV